LRDFFTKNKKRLCYFNFSVIASEAKQSRNFYHQTYFTGLLRRISSFLAETCAVSHFAGLHPATLLYLHKKSAGIKSQPTKFLLLLDCEV
jgi:hypothetical protein